ncbi:MAG: hypothetical protein AAFY76_14880 [Cyanobacteria bacterium J06649_11]
MMTLLGACLIKDLRSELAAIRSIRYSAPKSFTIGSPTGSELKKRVIEVLPPPMSQMVTAPSNF